MPPYHYNYNTEIIHPVIFGIGIAGGIITSCKTVYKLCNRFMNWYDKKTDKEEENQARLIKLIENASEQLNSNTNLINKILENKINNEQ